MDLQRSAVRASAPTPTKQKSEGDGEKNCVAAPSVPPSVPWTNSKNEVSSVPFSPKTQHAEPFKRVLMNICRDYNYVPTRCIEPRQNEGTADSNESSSCQQLNAVREGSTREDSSSTATLLQESKEDVTQGGCHAAHVLKLNKTCEMRANPLALADCAQTTSPTSEVSEESRPSTTMKVNISPPTSSPSDHSEPKNELKGRAPTHFNRVIPLHIERPVYWDDADFADFRDLLPPDDAVCEVCLESVAEDQEEWCRMLCECRSSWMHYKCAADKFNTGYNGGLAYLLVCGTCRNSSLGKQCCQWMETAIHLLNVVRRENEETKKFKVANIKEAHALALDVVGFIVRFGRGAKRNVLVGLAVLCVVSAMYELNCLENDTCQPTELAAGELCLAAERILGAQPSLTEAHIIQNMIHVCSSETQQNKWLDIADGYVQRCKRVIPETKSGLLRLADFRALVLKLLRPSPTLSSLLQAVQGWSHEIRLLDAPSCHTVCAALLSNDGIRHMGEFYDHGADLNPSLFDQVTRIRRKQIKIDLSYLRSVVLADETTNEGRVWLGEEFWKWGREELTDLEVLECLKTAYMDQHVEPLFEAQFGES